MYLSELKLWNFRKYGIDGIKFENSEPGIVVNFHDGVNVLVGENDSGKTAIVDAIRYVLKTQSLEFIQIDEKDFHKPKGKDRTSELKIECTFNGFSDDGSDAGHFLEWIGFDDENKFQLKIRLYAKIKDDNVIYQTIRSGIDSEGSFIEGDARDLLRVIYLKPLRDALSEMTQGNKSRFAQILKSLDKFKREKDKITGKRKKHLLEEKYDLAKKEIDSYFTDPNGGEDIIKTINHFLNEEFFIGSKAEREDKKAVISLAENELSEILRQLNLILEDNKSGLGSLNLLYIAAELLHLSKQRPGLKLTMIEELEAHLHPQYQLRLIDFIQEKKEKYGQFILTTHSTTLASSIELENLIICKGNQVFPMGHENTQLEKGDYRFLQKFLDATKANLFFAKGVIIVEGDAENLLIPTIAKIIERPLHQYGVSIVNVGSTAFNRYRKIFLRKGKNRPQFKSEWLDIKVSVITDLDIPSIEYWDENDQPKIFIIQDKNIEDLMGITDDIVWENLIDIPINSNSDFKELYLSNKRDGTTKLKNGVPKLLKEEFSKFERKLDAGLIKEIRANKKVKFEKRVNCQYVKGFLPDCWTLEYDIACSNLFKELETAIRLAKRLDSNGRNIISAALIETTKNDVEEKFETLDEETAYKIFKPLNEGSVSKATTAQCLALLLEKNEERTKKIIQTDPYLKYIREAIYHVTEPSESEGGQDDEE